MKKYRMKLIALALTLSCVISTTLVGTANAADTSNMKVSRFADFISYFFESPDEWRVIDIYGNDVSDQYYSDNINLYRDEKFEELMIRSEGIIDSLQFNDGTEDSITPYRAAISRSTYQEFICVYGDPSFGTYPESQEVYVRLSGQYTVDRDTGAILSVNKDSPSLSIVGWGDVQHGEVNYAPANVRTSFSSTGSKVEFTATFDIYRTNGIYDTEVFIGNYTIAIIGDSRGGEATEYRPNDGSGNRYVEPN